ncbi:hypothetical protein ACFVKB_30050 [Rhodococcus sp. NPDC127530]|uniref:hypothetical protein n=1 Tax=unclassified Rhodococcus (in: high G+C Gram-positive bacteria) TaxID=192944 RepID=UPI00363ECE63
MGLDPEYEPLGSSATGQAERVALVCTATGQLNDVGDLELLIEAVAEEASNSYLGLFGGDPGSTS